MSAYTEIDLLVISLSQCLADQVESLEADFPDYLAQSPEPAKTYAVSEKITPLLKTESDETSAEEPAIKFSETALSLAFQSLFQRYLDQYIQDDACKQPERSNNKSLNGIFALLDIAILLQSDLPIAKRIFYELLLQILKFLIPCSLYSLSHFWDYMDIREKTLKTRVFDTASIVDRISVLEVHNGIIGAYGPSIGQSSLKNPSWADSLKSRVQILLSNIVLFEDTTGLNKHFKIADRDPPNAKLTAPFLQDVLFLHKVINNPVKYFASTDKAELKETILVIKGIYTFLLREEKNFLKSHTPLHVIAEVPTVVRNDLSHKSDLPRYFPDSYWLYSFESQDSSPADTDYIKSKFTEQSVRTQYLFIIYVLANFYTELTASARKDLMVSVNAAPNAKFVTDESFPDVHKDFFESVKADILEVFEGLDPSFGALLRRTCVLEKTWWAWLVNGKDPKTNKPYIDDRSMPEAEISQVRLKEVLPFKGKKYFNTYITPQLSRKMRVPTGLAKLKCRARISSTELEERIQILTTKIEQVDSHSKERNELLEERTSLYWTLVRQQKQIQGLTLSNDLRMDIINPPQVGKDDGNQSSMDTKDEDFTETNIDHKSFTPSENGMDVEGEQDGDKNNASTGSTNEIKSEESETAELKLSSKRPSETDNSSPKRSKNIHV